MGHAKRPASIRWFERLFYVGLLLAVLNSVVVVAHIDPGTDLGKASIGLIVMVAVVSTALNLLFLWLIAYRASRITQWIYIGLVAIGFIFVAADIGRARSYGDLAFALTLVQYFLCGVGIGLLFRRDSRDWFAGRRPVDPAVFR